MGCRAQHHGDVVGQTGDVTNQMNDVGGKPDRGIWVVVGGMMRVVRALLGVELQVMPVCEALDHCAL